MSSNSDKQGTKRTVVEEGTHFKGDLTSSCPIDVRGKVEGEIQAPSLTVSAAGAVHGRAKVGSVRSEGELSGEFEAETIELSGTVKDQTVIRARSIEVKLSSGKGQQVLFGDCELSVGEEPSEHDVVEEPQVAEVARASEATATLATNGAKAASTEEGAASAADDADDEAEHESSEVAESAADRDLPGNIAEALSSEVNANGRQQNGAETASGWSQPPSQPPPAE